ncbi:hypothetical protein DCS_01600 [Drechmeria coniospora]|uniref:Uncharacterized protein n=1 Tax=Drechmeria coniospora TaxID=98403 RepID=A0A151GTT1_DRECN|nr:hypothetical protein DCS_01600 [Drechmeria coniospora]KYK60463.1 hypothetical protein DCS_01600 [Drechmeria coniospora]ODA80618.1 hypothetical protein RJ55_03577 [Drechmeria coniospora]
MSSTSTDELGAPATSTSPPSSATATTTPTTSDGMASPTSSQAISTPPSDDGSGMSAQPFIWVIIPLLAIFATGCFTFFAWRRHMRARRRGGDGLDDLVLMPSGFYMARTGRRPPARASNRIRSVEGLNELGEAPPPYDAKRPPSVDSPGADLGASEVEQARSPEADGIVPPPEAHVAESSRANG